MPETPQEEYVAELTEALELRDVPAAAAAHIVREVQSHIADSGQDPTAAFGSPSEYADKFAPNHPSRLWELIIASVVLAAGGGYVLISGVFGLLAPTHELWGLPPWMRIVIGSVGVASFIALVLIAGARAKRRSLDWQA
ncbi:HAAS signaling domain-containing protein [Arthrobacter sp. D1-17]